MAPQVDVLGCRIDRVVMHEAVARCRDALVDRRFLQPMAVNAAKLVAMEDDPDLRRAVRECELITADGQSVVWASRALGDPLPERVAGIDLMQELLGEAARDGWRVYVLGARREVLETAVGRLRDRYPGLILAGYRDGYFLPEEDEAVAREVARTRADILFVAISSPRKEVFLGHHGHATGAAVVMGVGGSIDVLAGLTRRAPRWMQRAGLEWLYRLSQEPRRLAGRYARTNLRFMALVARQRVSRTRNPSL